MRRIKILFTAGVLVSLLASSFVFGLSARSQADTTNAPSLVISQFKITSSSGQFFTLYNNTNTTLSMSKYQLEYFNSYDLAKATSSRLISLQGSLPPHGYYMVNDDSLLLCYQLTINSMSLGLSSTAGMVEVLSDDQPMPGASVTPTLQDYVSWSKTAATGAQTLPTNSSAFLQRQPTDSQYNPAVTVAGGGSWQTVLPGASPCSLVSATTGASVSTGLTSLLPGTEPPAIVDAADDTSGVAAVGLPDADIGLASPLITEILPNPSGTSNDATEEFIEVYNPNDMPFDLSGFALQTGTTALHSYTFPAGTMLAARSYMAYYSASTGLSLSNSGGQARVLDPYGNAIYATAVYGTANDGLAWALAQGQWYWTSKLTPGATNIIIKPPAKSTASKTAKSKATKTSKAKTTANKTKKTKAVSQAALTVNAEPASANSTIHPAILALVIGLALLYLSYEYRTDIQGRIFQLRRYISRRQADRT